MASGEREKEKGKERTWSVNIRSEKREKGGKEKEKYRTGA